MSSLKDASPQNSVVSQNCEEGVEVLVHHPGGATGLCPHAGRDEWNHESFILAWPHKTQLPELAQPPVCYDIHHDDRKFQSSE